MAVRVHAEKAVSAEEEQEWQVHMEIVGHRQVGTYFWLECAGNRGENVEKGRTAGARTGCIDRGKKWENARFQG